MPQNTNEYGPGNQAKLKKISGRPTKMGNPMANTLMGDPNPMGDMGDMGGMTGMNAAPQQMSSPSMGGGYNQQQQDRLAINGEQPSGANVIKSPEGPTRAGGWRKELPGVAGMSSMGAQPTGAAGNQAQGLPYTTDPSTGPNIRYWDDPQARVDDIVDPDRGFISTPTGSGLAGTDTYGGMDYSRMGGGQSPQVAGWDDPAMGGMPMDDPMMNDPMMGQPDMGGMPMNDPMMGGMPMNDPMMDGMPMGQALTGGDALSNALYGGPQSDFTEAQVAGPETDSSPTTSQFNEEVAPSVSGSPAISTPQSGFEQDDLGRWEATPRGIQQSEEDANAMVDEMAEKGFVYNEETKKFDQSGVAPTVSMPPAGVKNWKGDDTPFEPVLRDDRFISKSDTERPATPPGFDPVNNRVMDDDGGNLAPSRRKPYMPPNQGPAGGPAGSKPEVGEDTYEDFVSSWEAKAKDIRTNPGDWVKDPDVGRQAQRNTKTGESWDPEEMYRRNVERNNKRDAEEALLPPKTGQVTIDGKHYWKASDRGKPGVPESGTFAANGRLVAIDGKDVWGDPEADKPALEEFKDKVDAGEVSDEDLGRPDTREGFNEDDWEINVHGHGGSWNNKKTGESWEMPSGRPSRFDEQRKTAASKREGEAAWNMFHEDLNPRGRGGQEFRRIREELGIDKAYGLKMRKIDEKDTGGGPRGDRGGRGSSRVTTFEGPDGRRFQRSKLNGFDDVQGKWTEVGKEGPADEGGGKLAPNYGDWTINKNGMYQNNTTGEEISQDEMKRLQDSQLTTMGDTPDPADKFSEVGDAAYGEEAFNPDDWAAVPPTEEERMGQGSMMGHMMKNNKTGEVMPGFIFSGRKADWEKEQGGGEEAPGADAGSASQEDLNNPDNWDTSNGQYVYRGAEFGKTNTNPPADTEDWAQTRAAAASRSASAGGELPERGQDQLVGEEERRHLDGGTNLTTPAVSRPVSASSYSDDGPDSGERRKVDRMDRDDYDLSSGIDNVPLDLLQNEYGDIDGINAGMLELNPGGSDMESITARDVSNSQTQQMVNDRVAGEWAKAHQAGLSTVGSEGLRRQGMDSDPYSEQKIGVIANAMLGGKRAQKEIPLAAEMSHQNKMKGMLAQSNADAIRLARMLAGDQYSYNNDLTQEELNNQKIINAYGDGIANWR